MFAFYTYMWLRENGIPYYVGKGKSNRAFEGHIVGNHILQAPPKEQIIIQEFDSEYDAFVAEKFLIQYFGRKDKKTGCLRNLTDGGQGQSNPSDEVRYKIGCGNRGKSLTQDRIAKLIAPRIGKTLSIEHRALLKLRWAQRKACASYIPNRLGKTISAESKRKIGDGQRKVENKGRFKKGHIPHNKRRSVS